MIECKMMINDETICLKAKGHAGYAEEGKDIVCASVSTLFNTLAEFLRQKGLAFDCRLERGDIEIKLAVREDWDGLWDIISFVSVGFHIISSSYPDNIKFSRIL